MASTVPCTADDAVVLSLGGNPDGASPTLPIRWCMSRESVEFLTMHNIGRPFLLVVVVRDRGEEVARDCRFKEIDREMFPLKNMMGWLQFRMPGKFTILSEIVWAKDGKRPRHMDRSYYYSGESWKHELLNPEKGTLIVHTHPDERCCRFEGEYVVVGEEEDEFGNKERKMEKRLGDFYADPRINHHAIVGKPIDVVIDDHFFAPEPPEWEKKWVNLVVREILGESPDQCSYRERRIFAYTLQPFLVLGFVVVRSFIGLLIALWYGLFAIRGINLRPIFHPFSMTLGNIRDNIDCTEMIDSAFVVAPRIVTCEKPHHAYRSDHNADCFANEHQLRTLWFLWLPLLPIFFVIAGIAGLFFFNINEWGKSVPLNLAILITIGAPSALSIGIGILAAILWVGGWILGGAIALLGYLLEPLGDFWAKRTISVQETSKPDKRELRRVREEEERKKIRIELAPMVCTGAPMPVALEALPEDRQTIYLRFSAFKAKICKPFRK